MDFSFLFSQFTPLLFYCSASSFMMSSSMSLVGKNLEYLRTGVPSGWIRNFSKFQDISDLLTGDQLLNLGFPRRFPFESEGLGRLLFRKVKIGFSSLPFTATFWKMVARGTKPLPGRTCSSAFKISPLSQFS